MLTNVMDNEYEEAGVRMPFTRSLSVMLCSLVYIGCFLRMGEAIPLNVFAPIQRHQKLQY